MSTCTKTASNVCMCGVCVHLNQSVCENQASLDDFAEECSMQDEVDDGNDEDDFSASGSECLSGDCSSESSTEAEDDIEDDRPEESDSEGQDETCPLYPTVQCESDTDDEGTQCEIYPQQQCAE